MRPRGGPPRMSEGVAASSLCYLPRQTPMAPSSVPRQPKVLVAWNTESVQADPPSSPTGAAQGWRSLTGASNGSTRSESALRLRPEAPTFHPPSTLSAGAWCFTPPIIDLTAVLPSIQEGDEWAEDAGVGTTEMAVPEEAPILGSSLCSKIRAGSHTGAPAGSRDPSATSADSSTTAKAAIKCMTGDGALACGEDPAAASMRPRKSANARERAGKGDDGPGGSTGRSLPWRNTAPRRALSRGLRRRLPRKAPKANKKESTSPRRKEPTYDVQPSRRKHPRSSRTPGAGRRRESRKPHAEGRRAHSTVPSRRRVVHKAVSALADPWY
ncbi:hypothetical protein THAOC_18889 [Thalassiosira oceanica]|uniref:Uncharacterized protein n=1 Tax=Thalassiosira oceanica TaxID=159749 RepID=K0S3V2_THAOC|nr:hypothetical protein THAOC_18889 [Thalassiosira oceanica]|eukprot:EJK60708.1 hypothetical protein THAOC_18889 [Thalassiosira oceanica]